jgi:hypothetical protein
MRLDLPGKIRNTNLPRSKALFPLFEAVVNSFHALEDSGEPPDSRWIHVTIERDSPLPDMGVEGRISAVVISDNGVGFDALNLDAFFTSDTQYKASRGGKGIGRFIWLKAFRAAHVDSHYRENGRILRRSFDFTASSEVPDGPSVPSELDLPLTSVRLVDMLSPYKEECPRSLSIIGHRIVEHCLPFFLDPNCPEVTLSDSNETIDLNEHFRQHFAEKASSCEFSVGDQSFTLRGLRLYNPHETYHRLLYAANSREVLSERLEKYLPNLQRRLFDDVGSFVYLGFVEGDYLNNSVNSERTAFSFPVEREEGSMLTEVTLSAVRQGALACVSQDLKTFLDEINQEKRSKIEAYIAEQAPQYRPLRRHLDEFIDLIRPGVAGRELELALHEQLYEKERQLKTESSLLMSEANRESLRPEEYEAKVNDFLERANEFGKSSLAQHVAHRRVILEFLEKSLQADPESGRYSLEEVVHRIIYPMKTTSEEVPYEQQNLWIIDERLSYHAFLASDVALRAMTPIDNASGSRPDLMIFDNALSFNEGETPLQSVVIIEFKRPNRSEFSKEDPIEQVYRLIREIKRGHFKDKDGREIKVQSDQMPVYAYVICDTTKEVDILAEDKNLIRTPDRLGYFGYNANLSAYIEVISYDKLLRDAKKRNRILFDKLQLPPD